MELNYGPNTYSKTLCILWEYPSSGQVKITVSHLKLNQNSKTWLEWN